MAFPRMLLCCGSEYTNQVLPQPFPPLPWANNSVQSPLLLKQIPCPRTKPVHTEGKRLINNLQTLSASVSQLDGECFASLPVQARLFSVSLLPPLPILPFSGMCPDSSIQNMRSLGSCVLCRRRRFRSVLSSARSAYRGESFYGPNTEWHRLHNVLTFIPANLVGLWCLQRRLALWLLLTLFPLQPNQAKR